MFRKFHEVPQFPDCFAIISQIPVSQVLQENCWTFPLDGVICAGQLLSLAYTREPMLFTFHLSARMECYCNVTESGNGSRQKK